jgi:UDP-GlcNAc:undecaprenyl-phosphate GlcNAc-1-phosphate transferase
MKPFLISMLLTALLTPCVIVVARRQGWIARPRADRWHSRPTALMGGIAIFLGTLTAWLITGHLPSLLPVLVPAIGMFLLGLVDDRIAELLPHQKLIGQVAAGAVLIIGGVQFRAVPPLLALPLTLFWVVGITNAVNLLDNMDGLAAGVCGLSALVLAGYSLRVGAPGTAAPVLALAGGCFGFLIYNFNPAKIFMGDCGSMFIGFSLAALAVQASNRSASHVLLSLLVPVAVMAIPIFDTTLVAITRGLNGRPIFPGFRDHSSHRMVALGLSERSTVLLLYGLAALFGGLALLATRLPILVVLLLTVPLLMGLLALGFYLGFIKVYPEKARANPPLRLRWYLRRPAQFLQAALDLVLIPAAFVGAHELRFEGDWPAFIARGVAAALPLVLVAKLVGLVLCRSYRGVWRFAGPADALSAAAGSTVGSLLALLLLAAFVGFGHLSRAALVIDWLALTMLVVVSRTGYLFLQELFGRLSPPHGQRVIILGAEREALALIWKLRDPLSPQRVHLLGILDDDPRKQGRTLNGVPVLGPLCELPKLMESKDATLCLLGVSRFSAAGAAIRDFCYQQRIPVHRDLDSLHAIQVDDPVVAAA